MLERGKQQKVSFEEIKISPKQCFTFSYTSGTTGPPKGAMISHQNVLSLISSLLNHDSFKEIHEGDRYLSYLPLPHVMERGVVHSLTYWGVFIVYHSFE